MAGSLKYVAESGASSVTYYETTGWRGVLERNAGSELPDRFRSVAGEVFPLYHPLCDAIEWEGGEVLACTSSDVLAVLGLAVRRDDGAVRLLVINLTPVEQQAEVGPLDGWLSLRDSGIDCGKAQTNRPVSAGRSRRCRRTAGSRSR